MSTNLALPGCDVDVVETSRTELSQHVRCWAQDIFVLLRQCSHTSPCVVPSEHKSETKVTDYHAERLGRVDIQIQ